MHAYFESDIIQSCYLISEGYRFRHAVSGTRSRCRVWQQTNIINEGALYSPHALSTPGTSFRWFRRLTIVQNVPRLVQIIQSIIILSHCHICPNLFERRKQILARFRSSLHLSRKIRSCITSYTCIICIKTDCLNVFYIQKLPNKNVARISCV